MTMQRALSSPNKAPLTVPMPVINPSAGVVLMSSSMGLRLRCAARRSAPYSMKLPGSHRSSMFSRAVRWFFFAGAQPPRADSHRGRMRGVL